MRAFSLMVLVAVLVGCGSEVALTGHSTPGAIYLRPHRESPDRVPTLPAHIVLEDKRFEEPNSNRALDAEEEGVLILQVRNDGLGPGKVTVRLTPVGDMEHVTFRRNVDVGVVGVQESRNIRIPIAAGEAVTDGQRELRVEVLEEYSRGAIPFALSFDTRGLVAPDFRVIVRDCDDGRFYAGNTPDGIVQAGEMVKVVANVQNVGGLAEGVEVQVEVDGDEVRFTRDLHGNPDDRFVIGGMAPGASQDLVFYFYTTPVFATSRVEIGLRVRESRGRFGLQEALAFDIGQRVRTEEVLAVQAVGKQVRQVDPVQSDLVDIDKVPTHSQTRLDDGLAIIFGIEEYRHTFPAAYKNRDATTFYRYCREVLGIPEDRILLRTDSDATKAEFDYVFEPRDTPNQGWLKMRLRRAEEASKTDVFVYLAGHGFPDLATGSPYLIPHDVRPEQATNGVPLERLYRTLSEFGARSVTLFVESCFSGASGYDPTGSEKLLAMDMNPVFPVMEQPMIGPQTVVFAATGGKRPSNNRDDLKHGIFTYFVLKGLGGAADADGDGEVTVGELFGYVEREVPRKALEPPLDREQVPQLLPPPERLGERGERVLVRY